MKVTIRDQAFSVGAITIFNWIAKLREFLREAWRMSKKDTPAVLANKYSFVWIWASKLVENTFQRRFKRLNKLKVLRCHVSCFAIKWIWKQIWGAGVSFSHQIGFRYFSFIGHELIPFLYFCYRAWPEKGNRLGFTSRGHDNCHDHLEPKKNYMYSQMLLGEVGQSDIFFFHF